MWLSAGLFSKAGDFEVEDLLTGRFRVLGNDCAFKMYFL